MSLKFVNIIRYSLLLELMMAFSVQFGPMVGQHKQHSVRKTAVGAIEDMVKLGLLNDEVTKTRLNRLKVGRALRFDTEMNTGISVVRLSAKRVLEG